MTTDTGAVPDTASDKLGAEAAKADAAMARLQEALRRLGDGDLHRAHRGGGWTVAQVISHMNVATLLWLGDLTRLSHDPDLRFFFREEIGHDALGYPPPTVEIALRQLDSHPPDAGQTLPARRRPGASRTATSRSRPRHDDRRRVDPAHRRPPQPATSTRRSRS